MCKIHIIICDNFIGGKKMNNILNVNTKLALFDYMALVQEIAYGFIDYETGTYQPHIGNLNAMKLFYNRCVIESKFDEKYPHNVTNVDAMAEIISDDDFMEAFNKAIKHDGETVGYDFANAYKDALDIVNVKKTSFGLILNVVNTLLEGLKEKVMPLLTEENTKSIHKIAEEISGGKTSAEAVVNAYVQKLVNKENNTDKTGN